MRKMLRDWKQDAGRSIGAWDIWCASKEEKMRCRSTFLAREMASMRREEKRQARRRRSIQKRAELLDAIDFGKKERARSSKDGCIRWRYEYEGWVYVTDETSQHEVVRWKVSLPVASCRLLVINEPAFAENHSDSKGTSRETQVGNALPAGEKPVAERCGRTGQQSTQGQSDREVEEKTRQCMDAKQPQTTAIQTASTSRVDAARLRPRRSSGPH